MDEKETPQEKKVDETWKETVEKEKEFGQTGGEALPEASFSLFITSLMMEALIALGDVENPVSHKKESHPDHAKFIIDTLSMLQEKTKNNLTDDESRMLEAILYELRMKYVNAVK